jgi:hypothetical protein
MKSGGVDRLSKQYTAMPKAIRVPAGDWAGTELPAELKPKKSGRSA